MIAKIYDKDIKLMAVSNKIHDLYVLKSFLSKKVEKAIYKNALKLTDKVKLPRTSIFII